MNSCCSWTSSLLFGNLLQGSAPHLPISVADSCIWSELRSPLGDYTEGSLTARNENNMRKKNRGRLHNYFHMLCHSKGPPFLICESVVDLASSSCHSVAVTAQNGSDGLTQRVAAPGMLTALTSL